MTSFAALLRGINVGGHKRVGMASLRGLAADLGYAEPATYLQSGNLVIASDAAPAAIARDLEAGIASQLGVAGVAIVVRTAAELAALVAANPFPEAAAEPTTLVVCFLDREPAAAAVAALVEAAAEHAPERLEVIGRDVVMHLPNGQGRANLPPLIGRHLKDLVATTRNWRTVLKVRELARARE